MDAPSLGLFSIMNPQALGNVLGFMEFRDISALSLTNKQIRILVNKSLEQIAYLPPEAYNSKSKKALEGLSHTTRVFSSWMKSPATLLETWKKWVIIRNLMAHGEQLETLAICRADWRLIDACFQRLTYRIHEIARQWIVTEEAKEPDLDHYRTPKGWTYLMILAKAGQWGLLGKHAREDNRVIFEMCEDGETLLTVSLMETSKNPMVVKNLTKRLVDWGGKQQRPGDDRALALAAYLGRWDLVDLLLQRDANPCHVTSLTDGTKLCPLTSFLQHQRTETLKSKQAKALISQIPELGAVCLMVPQHPFPAHLIDEEAELFLETLIVCDQNKTYYHPFSNHKEYPIQILPESNIDDFPAALRKLTKQGADINACAEGRESVPFLSRWIKLADEDNKTECRDELRALIQEFKPNLEMADGTGATPFHYACAKGNAIILKELVESIMPSQRKHALMVLSDGDGFSPAMMVARNKQSELYKYVCTTLGLADLDAYEISRNNLIQKEIDLHTHLKAICNLYCRDHDKLLDCIRKCDDMSFENENVASVFAEICPAFAMKPMQSYLGLENWKVWISKTWCSPAVAEKWANYYIAHPCESRDWRLYLSMLNGPLSLDKQTIAEQLVLGAAHNEEVGTILAAWIEKFGRMKNPRKPLLELYLQEGGKDREIVNLLVKSLTPEQVEHMLIDLWGGRQYIDDEIYRNILEYLEKDSLKKCRNDFKQALSRWKLTTVDEDEAKSIIEEEDT